MDISLYQAAAAMNASTRWQEAIADNLSANQVPGFKKQSLSFSAVQAGFLATNSSSPAAKRAAMPLATASTNFQAGELHTTGVPTDLAIDGPGFFEVRMADGSHGYTRDGEFRLNLQGQLITKQGLPVMGLTGPLQFDPSSGSPITVGPAGEVSQGGEPKGQIKLTEFGNSAALETAGTGLFLATDPAAQPRAATASGLKQGCLENANTSSMAEMSSLIAAMRYYEANHKIIQTEDERVSKLISDIANPV
jgi:flagellar basal body rod protein FlgG